MIKNMRKGLGKKSVKLLTTLAEVDKRIFTLDDAIKILKIKRPTLTKLIYDLVKKNWLFRLSKGKFLLLPLKAGFKPIYNEHEFIIASCLIKPYYVSYWSALNYYGLTEQVPRTVFIATIKRKRNITILGIDYKFITINKKKFFGFKKLKIEDKEIMIAEKEKCIIDCLDMPRYSGGIIEVAKAIWNAKDELNFTKMVNYARKMDNVAALSRLSYILNLFEIKSIKINAKAYSLLDPLGKMKGRYISKFKIIENISRKEMLEWREH